MKNTLTQIMGHYLNMMSHVSPRLAARQGFRVFCYPVRPALKAHHRQFLNSSKKFSFHHNDVRIQGYEWGHGEKKILFLHGWQSHSFRWKKYVEALPKDEYTIYAIDAPGHGFSKGSFLTVPLYSNVINQFISMQGPIHTTVSHSIGSFSILNALHRTPSLPIERLILMAPPGEARDFVEFFKQTLNLSDRSINLVVKHFEERIEQPVDFFSTSKFASSLSLPGLIIHDEEDDETPYKYARMIHEAWKSSRLITTKGLRHNLKSPEVVKAVKDFITMDLPDPVMKTYQENFS
jgi:pimeloyl-ACP methyl ester carboxylesterase